MHTSYARYKCMGALYYKLAAFIPNTKDVWDFCLGGLKEGYQKYQKKSHRILKSHFLPHPKICAYKNPL
ncbi:hypothetical protein VN0128_04620 [Helicobacter pylori]